MLTQEKIVAFLMQTCLFLAFIFLGGYLRLYLIGRIKGKTVLLISVITFLVGESLIIYLNFFRG